MEIKVNLPTGRQVDNSSLQPKRYYDFEATFICFFTIAIGVNFIYYLPARPSHNFPTFT